MMETGTLKGLGVKPGDVVEYTFGGNATGMRYPVTEAWLECALSWEEACKPYWRIISRASDNPRTWGEMTPEEKGALLLADHEGKVIEAHCDKKGWVKVYPSWDLDLPYRVRPEPKRETVKRYYQARDSVFDTHVITFDTINGKPDCASIKMEEL